MVEPQRIGPTSSTRIPIRRLHSATAGKALVAHSEGGLARTLLDNPLQLVVIATLLAAALGLCGRHSRPGRALPVPRSRTSTFPSDRNPLEGSAMLYTFAVVMILLWLLGLLSSYTMGGFIHVLLVMAFVVVVIQLIQGRKLL